MADDTDDPIEQSGSDAEPASQPAAIDDGGASKVFHIRGPDDEMFLRVTIEDVTARREAERLRNAPIAQSPGRTQDELRALVASLLTLQEDDRRRLARELHDDIGQRLALLEIDTQQIDTQIARNPEQARHDLDKVRTAIRILSDDVRKMSHALHPSAIDDLGISPAIRSLVDDFREREGMIATFSGRNVPENIPPQTASGLYRITEEALRNVARHAGKAHVKVLLRGVASGIRLQVIDSGEGFDVQQTCWGCGLISMRERARQMQGTLKVESELGEGTRVTVEVPSAQLK